MLQRWRQKRLETFEVESRAVASLRGGDRQGLHKRLMQVSNFDIKTNSSLPPITSRQLSSSIFLDLSLCPYRHPTIAKRFGEWMHSPIECSLLIMVVTPPTPFMMFNV